MTTREGKAIPFQAVLPAHAAGVQEGDVTPVVLYDQNGNTIGGNEPLRYVVTVSQLGTAAPVVNEISNSTKSTFVWARSAVGVYSIEASSLVFAPNKTVGVATSGASTAGTISVEVETEDVVNVYTWDGGGLASDGILSDSVVILEIYP